MQLAAKDKKPLDLWERSRKGKEFKSQPWSALRQGLLSTSKSFKIFEWTIKLACNFLKPPSEFYWSQKQRKPTKLWPFSGITSLIWIDVSTWLSWKGCDNICLCLSKIPVWSANWYSSEMSYVRTSVLETDLVVFGTEVWFQKVFHLPLVHEIRYQVKADSPVC